MNQQFVSWAKTIDWQSINDVCESLDDLNDSQYRFIKGRFIELLIEHFSHGVLDYVGEVHKDYDCKKFNCTIELKSVTSQRLYKTLKGKSVLRESNNIILNNSMGTNKKTLDPNNVADYLIIVKSDGAVLTDRNTVVSRAKINGDGCVVILKPNDVVELSGKLNQYPTYSLNMKEKIDNLLCDTIANLDTFKKE
jgi:hypothetical protein